MGLTNRSTGAHAADGMLAVVKRRETDSVVALAGNPNVGKSTVFNELTGMNQHTGNWPGKTVASAQGYCETGGWGCVLVDIPGCYSLMAHSAEEAVARDFICFGGANAVVVVCDASCLERNLNLALQAMEITDNVVLCVNLMDEARRKGVEVDAALLGQRLGVPVVPAAARSGEGLPELMCAVERVARGECAGHVCRVRYAQPVEAALALLTPAVANAAGTGGPAPRWLALRLLEGDTELNAGIVRYLGFSLAQHPDVAEILARARRLLAEGGVTQEALHDEVVRSLVRTAETVCIGAVRCTPTPQELRDRRLDRILTSRRTGFPLMLLLLLGVFWLTITGANVPSQLLADGLFWVGDRLGGAMAWAGAPVWVKGLLVDGVYRVLAWVVSVMLPPMAIFFPLFTLLEDLGYLPRVAFNLDRTFKKCRACGKQALTMAMGFGCNAAGVVGCRIIDSPRERLIAMLTNNFVPCNGRFPTLIAILTMFFVGASGGFGASLASAALLTGLVLLGVGATFLASRLLSGTVLKGVPSSFTLELPPYRRPQIGKVIVRSIFDRTLFVLGRAAMVAAPAGMLIWVMPNLTLDGQTLLTRSAAFLDPAARFFGLDGVILLAFILGFPANEIVVPIIIMAYLSTGSLVEMNDLSALHTLLVQNGWTWVTAVCTMLFSLMHWPCSTTCITIRKESQSWKWTAAAFALPTAAGLASCALVANGARLVGRLLGG